jgi:hypothetical protein
MLKLLVLQKKSGDPGISWTITTVTLIQQQLNNFLTNLRNPSTKFSKTTSRQKFHPGSTLVPQRVRPTKYFDR